MELRKYGVATTAGTHIVIPIVKAGSNDYATSGDWTPAGGDVKISKDGGASANIGTLPTFITGIGWQFVFTAAELSAKRINVNIVDSATKAIEDDHFVIVTYGHASAMYVIDLDDAVRAGLTALPNAAAEAAGGLFTRGSGAGQVNQDANGRLDANVAAISQDVTAADALERLMDGAVLGTVDDATFVPTTTQFETDLTEASDGHYVNQVLKFGAGATNPGYTARISAYDGTNKRITVATALPNAPAGTDPFIIMGRID